MKLATRLRLRPSTPLARPDDALPYAERAPVDGPSGEPADDRIVVRVAGIDVATIRHELGDGSGRDGRYRWTERTDVVPDIIVAPDVERALARLPAAGGSLSGRPVVVVWERSLAPSSPGAAVRVLEGGADAFVASPDAVVVLAQLDALVRRPPPDATSHLHASSGSLAAAPVSYSELPRSA